MNDDNRIEIIAHLLVAGMALFVLFILIAPYIGAA
jgi:hypothetical protein